MTSQKLVVRFSKPEIQFKHNRTVFIFLKNSTVSFNPTDPRSGSKETWRNKNHIEKNCRGGKARSEIVFCGLI